MLEISNATTAAFKLNTLQILSLGDIVQLTYQGNNVVLSISDGLAPLGILTSISSVSDEGTVSYGRRYVTTDNYVTSVIYPLNANLYIADGKFTTVRPTPVHPAIALVVSPPSALDANLGCIWF